MQITQKIKSLWEGEGFMAINLSLALILVVLNSYGLGLVSIQDPKPPISITDGLKIDFDNQNDLISKGNMDIVASKSGTRYYYPSCAGVNRIKEENKIYFTSPEQAEASGLTIAANCAKP